jgi:hypothetical protein
MTILVIIMSIAWVSIIAISIYQWARKLYDPDIFEEGYNYIIIDGTESTKYPNRYSEGVFAFYQNGKLLTSEAYQIEKGGDPVVYKKYILRADTEDVRLSE